jgi:hypothetical protein
MVELIRRSAAWSDPASPSNALAQIQKRAVDLGGRVESSDGNSIIVKFGSRLSYRFWGVIVARGRKALPYMVTVSASEAADQSTLVSAEAVSDEGGFIVWRLPKAADLMDQRLATTLDALASQ